MNAEIYLLRGGNASSACGTEDFNRQMKVLAEHNVCVLYKTAVDNSESSLKEALKLSLTDDEGIDVVVVADAIEKSTRQNAEDFFAIFGVKKKDVRRISVEFDISTPEAKDDDKEIEIGSHSEKNSSEAEKKNVDVYSARVGSKNGVKMIILPKAESAEVEFTDLLYGAIYNACIKNNQKRAWWKNFIPIKGDKPLEIVRKSILMLAIATFIVSGTLLFNELVIKPMVADNTNNGVKSLLTEATGGGDSDDDDYNAVAPKRKKIVIGESEVLPDFEKLLNENKDTVGWIKVPNTQIDYVVCQSQDPEQPEYYLKRDFYGNYSDYGTIFLDYRSPLDAKNLILHGHHMNDGRMFANLLYYQDLNFYKENPAFTFNTIYEKAKWKIISIYKTNTLESQGEFFNYLRGTFETESDFMNYIYQVRARSIIDCPVDVNEDDTLVTLSTCAYDFDQFRFVVVARRVREGETAKVDTSTAKMASNPVYPDCWYEAYGGKKPVLTSFEEALAAKQITWYNNPHKKKWSASEAQKEATKKAEEQQKKEEEASKAAEKASKLKSAKAELESANSYLEIAKENYNSANGIYSDVKTLANSAKNASSTAYNNASSGISKAKSESAINSLIKDMNSAKALNNQVIATDMSKWKDAIDRQCDGVIEYVNAALKYSKDKTIKTEAATLKKSAEDYKSKIQSIMDGLKKLISSAKDRNSKLDNMIDKGNAAIKKLKAQESSKTESSKKPESSKEPSSSKPESSKEPSKKPESSKPESSKEPESSVEPEPESSTEETAHPEEQTA